MSPQAWPLPKILTTIITGGMKTKFLPADYNGTASGSPRTSPDVTEKTVANEAREAQHERQDKRGQALQPSRVKARDPTMLPRTADRNSASSTSSTMSTQMAAANIVKDTQERLGILGVSIHLRFRLLAR